MRHVPSALVVCALVGLAAGCSNSGAGSGDEAPDVDSLKLEAKRAFQDKLAAAPGRPADDPCTAHKWYGDGTCDSWCPTGDRDDCTVVDDGGVACAEIWSPADGKCDWSDPCGPTQDEDCQKDAGGVVCTLIYKLPDGACDASDPCSKVQDADCQTQPVLCPAVVYPEDGKCEAPVGCEQTDPDCARECIAIAYATNGKCEAASGCEASDPVDCANDVVCIEILYPTNGRCEAAKGCERTDPVDCK